MSLITECVFCLSDDSIDEEDSESAPLMATWHPDRKKFFVQGDGSNKSFYVHLADILSLKLDGGTSLFIKMTAYPLMNNKREKKIFEVHSRQSHHLYEELVKQGKELNIPHCPSKFALSERRYLVLLNPYSGQKQSQKLWESDCRPILDETGILYTLQYTKFPGHAVQIAQELNIDRYIGLMVLSGDGMISEVLTGLTSRTDRERALKLPILHVPAGTANALAAAVAYQANEPFSPRGKFCKEMILMAVRPSPKPLRLYHVETANDGHKLMFLTCVWGLIADIDLGSERFRWAGLIRLHIEAFIRIARLPQVAKYKGRISYKPVHDVAKLRNTKLKSHEVRERLGEGHFRVPEVEPYKGEILKNGETPESIQEGFTKHYLEHNIVPSLSEPVPSDWTTIEGEFAFVCLSSISHIGSDLPYCPSAKLGDEVMYLSLVDWRTIKTRFHIAHLLITIDQCLHLDHECFQMIPVLACRVEPAENAGGYVAIDGEPVTSGSSFQVVSTALTATVIGRET